MPETDLPGNSAPAQPVAQPDPIAPVAEPEPQFPVAPQPAPVQPIEARDRTRDQFEKLLESNRRLNERNLVLQQELERRQQSSALTFDPFQAQRQTPQQQVNPNDFIEIDPNTGDKFINEQRLRARLEEVTQKANRLEQTLQGYVKTAEEREVERQEKETYSAYPELNPNSKNFDPSFNRNVRSILTDSFYNAQEYGGSPLSFKEAADFVRAQFPKPAQQQPAPAVDDKAKAEEAAAAKAAKEQGSAQAVSQPRGQAQISDDDELETLRYRTRYLNDDEALARRILNTDHVIRDEETA